MRLASFLTFMERKLNNQAAQQMSHCTKGDPIKCGKCGSVLIKYSRLFRAEEYLEIEQP
jgi:hypothetical protein